MSWKERHRQFDNEWMNECRCAPILSHMQPPNEAIKKDALLFLVACTRLYNPLCLLVGWSVGRLVNHILLFFMILFLWPHCSYPNELLTLNMAPSHPLATSVAVFPALLSYNADGKVNGKLADTLGSCAYVFNSSWCVIRSIGLSIVSLQRFEQPLPLVQAPSRLL